MCKRRGVTLEIQNVFEVFEIQFLRFFQGEYEAYNDFSSWTSSRKQTNRISKNKIEVLKTSKINDFFQKKTCCKSSPKHLYEIVTKIHG